MTPTEEHYANGTTCNKEYKPGTCCMATVIILGESCTTVNGINTPKWSNQTLHNVSILTDVAGVS